MQVEFQTQWSRAWKSYINSGPDVSDFLFVCWVILHVFFCRLLISFSNTCITFSTTKYFFKQYHHFFSQICCCCLFDLILYAPVNSLSVMSGRVFLGWTSTLYLLKDTTQWRRWGSNLRPFGLELSTLPLTNCAPFFVQNFKICTPWRNDRIQSTQ